MLRTLIWPTAVALGLLLFPADNVGPALADGVAGDDIQDRSYGGAGGEQVRRRERPEDDSYSSGTDERSGKDAGKTSSGGGGGGGGASAEEIITSAVITEVERRILGDYARRNPDAFGYDGGGKGKGKKKKGLPPGIAMNLQRGKPLPPGLRDRHIPADLQSLLPGRKGTRLVPAGEHVLLVDKETEIILDVVEGILRGIGS